MMTPIAKSASACYLPSPCRAKAHIKPTMDIRCVKCYYIQQLANNGISLCEVLLYTAVSQQWYFFV